MRMDDNVQRAYEVMGTPVSSRYYYRSQVWDVNIQSKGGYKSYEAYLESAREDIKSAVVEDEWRTEFHRLKTGPQTVICNCAELDEAYDIAAG